MDPADDSSLESSLIARATAGDTAAFVSLVALHQARVRAFVGAYLRQPDEVDDLSQEVFLAAYRELARFRGEAAFGTWLIGIARHRVLNRLRAQVRESRSLGDLIVRRQLEELDGGSDGPERHERQLTALEECIGQLPAVSARIVSDHYFDRVSLAEIARRDGRGLGAVRMTLLRIRQALRDCLQHKLDAEAT